MGDVLTIKGEKKDEREEKKGGMQYFERRFGSFSRSIRLPFEAADEKVDANYDKGVRGETPGAGEGVTSHRSEVGLISLPSAREVGTRLPQ